MTNKEFICFCEEQDLYFTDVQRYPNLAVIWPQNLAKLENLNMIENKLHISYLHLQNKLSQC